MEINPRLVKGFSGAELHVSAYQVYHDLRHTFCSNLILSGSDLKDVKEMIGHKDLSTTDRYSHLTAIHKKHNQERLAAHYAR